MHVEHLVPELRKIIDVDVHCLGKPREDASTSGAGPLLDANPALQTIGADLGWPMRSPTATSPIPIRGMPTCPVT